MSINQHDKNSKLFRKFINETSIYDYDPETGEKTASKGVTDSGTVEVGHGNELIGIIGKPEDVMDPAMNAALGGLLGWLVAAGIIKLAQSRTMRAKMKRYYKKYKKQGLTNKQAYNRMMQDIRKEYPKIDKQIKQAIKDSQKKGQTSKTPARSADAVRRRQMARARRSAKFGKAKTRLGKIAGTKFKLAMALGGTALAVWLDPIDAVRDKAQELAVFALGDNPDLTKAEKEGNLISIDNPEYLKVTQFRNAGPSSSTQSSSGAPINATLDDKQALMSMMFAETSWSRDYNEMAAIIQVAINRKLAWKRSTFASVVGPQTTGWNNKSTTYTRNYNRAMSVLSSAKGAYKARAEKVSQLIDKMLAGDRPVGDLGGAKNWLHAGKMPRCNEPHGTKFGKRHYCFDYSKLGLPFGKRRIPSWAIQRGNGPAQLPGGTSKTKPTAVNTMVYSNGGKSLVARVPKKKTTSTTTSTVTSAGKVKNVAVIGDSIMATTLGAGGRLKKILQKDGINVNNLAVGSKTMQKVGKNNNHIAAQWNMVKQQGKVDVLVINGGTNDVLGMAWTSKTRRGQKSIEIFSNIVSEATSMGMKVLIFPILLPNKGRLYEPGGKLPENHPRRYTKEQIQQECTLWNNKLKQISNSSPNAFYVSGFEGMLISSGRRKSWLNSKDKVHPKGPESQKIASKLAEMIRGF